MTAFTLKSLAQLVASRAAGPADKSYTRTLLDAGVAVSAKKFGEEAVEFVIAAVERDRTAMKNEAADVLYHLLVVLQASSVSLQDVIGELERRTKRSGLEEKAGRQGQDHGRGT